LPAPLARGDYLAGAVAERPVNRTRIQLCGRVVAEIEGRRIEGDLPGRKGRLLFVYLVANRDRTLTRDEVAEALWPDGAPSSVDGDLRALVSKVRRAVGREALGLRSRFRLELPAGACIDLEVATDAIHRAEAAVASRQWARAWSASHVTLCTARRGFLPGEDAIWIAELRSYLAQLEVRALECYTAASIGIGPSELATAERCARALIQKEPFRESGHRLLMQALQAMGNRAEAVRAYDELRQLLRDELGIGPSPATQELHKQLL
jgi:SARP family transcriptional regulator, regulator of embCAB operon